MVFRHVSILLIASFILLYVCYIGIKNVFRYNKFYQDYMAACQDLTEAQQRRAKFLDQIAFMQTNMYWEIQAKAQLGFIRPGETVYKLSGKGKKKL